MCAELKDLADATGAVSNSAWAEIDPAQRAHKIRETKRQLQRLGIASTFLSNKTRGKINVVSEAARLRSAATDDPFEDPSRGADSTHEGVINSAVAAIMVALDQGCNRHYR